MDCFFAFALASPSTGVVEAPVLVDPDLLFFQAAPEAFDYGLCLIGSALVLAAHRFVHLKAAPTRKIKN